MAAWTEAERVKLRAALGIGNLWKQRFPLVENAMTTVLSTADGGASPDNSVQLYLQAQLADLDELFADMKKLWKKTHAVEVDEIKVDVARGLAVLRGEGRRVVKMISTALATDPISDIFSPGPYGSDMPFKIGSGY